jgi:hypothetical protein
VSTTPAVDLYRQLAEEHQRLNHPQERDRFLLLAADAALTAGQGDEAERLRKALLAQNPHHLLKPYSSLAEALKSSDIQAYIQQLRKSYPRERAAALLQELRKTQPGGPKKEEDFILPLDSDKRDGKEPFTFAAEPAATKKPLRSKEAGSMPEPQEPSKPSGAPLPSWRAPTSSPAPAPAAAPNIFKVRDEPTPAPRPKSIRTPAPLPEEPAESPSGAWVSTFLTAVAFLAALALLIYTIGAPFLPP